MRTRAPTTAPVAINRSVSLTRMAYPRAVGATLLPVPEPTFPDFTPTVPELLRVSRERYGAGDCMVTPDERLTYAELDERSGRLAARLVAEGVGKGAHVGILFPNGPAWVVAWAAVTRI